MQFNSFRLKLNLLVINKDFNKNLYKSYYNFSKVKINDSKYLFLFINLIIILFYNFYLNTNDFKQLHFYFNTNLLYS